MGFTGAEVSRRFHADVVGPLMARRFPELRYAAARLGSGSDVLGLDDAMSRDHDWGCRLTLLVDREDAASVPRIDEMLARELPARYGDLPVRFPTTWDDSVTHKVQVATVGDFAASRLGVDPLDTLSVTDWLSLPGHSVLEATAGPVFTDRTRDLSRTLARLRWYPPDLDRYVLACGWQRVSQQLPMVGRTAERGDELGSRVLCSALAEDLMRQAFLVHRRWPPYRKWFGTVFRSLPTADVVGPSLHTAVTAPDWRARQGALAEAATALLTAQSRRGLPVPSSPIMPFYDRPYLSLRQEVATSLLAGISDPEVAALPGGVGSVEQWIHNGDVLMHPERRSAAAAAIPTAVRH